MINHRWITIRHHCHISPFSKGEIKNLVLASLANPLSRLWNITTGCVFIILMFSLKFKFESAARGLAAPGLRVQRDYSTLQPLPLLT